MRLELGIEMLTRLYVDNYKCFVNFEYQPSSFELLLGENGSGKSTVFEVLNLLVGFVSGAPTGECFPSRTLTQWQNGNSQQIELTVELQRKFQYRLEIEQGSFGPQSMPRVRHEELTADGNVICRFRDGKGYWGDDAALPSNVDLDTSRSALAPVYSPGIAEFKQWLWGVKPFRLNPWAMQSFSEGDEKFLSFNGSNFVSWYRHVLQEHPAKAHEFLESLKHVLIGFDSLSLPSIGDNRWLVATMRPPIGEYQLSLNEMSEGQRALVVLYAILHFLVKRGSLICIDEPDNFISLREVQPWLTSLYDVSGDESCQVLLISHHPELIDYLAADHATRFSRNEGGPVRVQRFAESAVKGLSAAETVARGWDDEP